MVAVWPLGAARPLLLLASLPWIVSCSREELGDALAAYQQRIQDHRPKVIKATLERNETERNNTKAMTVTVALSHIHPGDKTWFNSSSDCKSVPPILPQTELIAVQCEVDGNDTLRINWKPDLMRDFRIGKDTLMIDAKLSIFGTDIEAQTECPLCDDGSGPQNHCRLEMAGMVWEQMMQPCVLWTHKPDTPIILKQPIDLLSTIEEPFHLSWQSYINHKHFYFDEPPAGGWDDPEAHKPSLVIDNTYGAIYHTDVKKECCL